jgi:pimeloyl-ACP methyl ester carboxylesterase
MLVNEPLDPAPHAPLGRSVPHHAGVLRDTAAFLKGVDKKQLLDVSKRLQQFDKPVLLLWGDADRFFKLDFARRLSRSFPDARLVEVSGGRTFHPLDDPRRVAVEIQSAFYAGAAPGNHKSSADPHQRTN